MQWQRHVRRNFDLNKHAIHRLGLQTTRLALLLLNLCIADAARMRKGMGMKKEKVGG
jgi:hypothetical protein